MRKTSLLVITWMIGATLAVGLALQGVKLFDSQLAESHPNAKSQSAVRAEIRELATSSTTVPTVASQTGTATTGEVSEASSTEVPASPTTTTTVTTTIPPVVVNGALDSAGRPRTTTTTTTTPLLVTPQTVAAEPPPTEAPTTGPPVTSPAPSPPPETAPTGPLRTVSSFSSSGGSIGVGFDGSRMDLAFVEPASGHVVTVRNGGPTEIAVDFTGPDVRFTIVVKIAGGALKERISSVPIPS